MIFALAGDLTLYAVLPAVALTTGIHLFNIGILLSANRFVRFVSNPLVGLFLTSHRRRTFFVTGLFLGAVTTLLYQFQNQFWIFLTGRILWGVAFSITFITGYSMVMDIAEQEKRGRKSGLLQTYYLIGFATTPVIGAMLYSKFNYPVAMMICSMLGFMGAIIALLFVPETFTLSNLGEIRSSANPSQPDQPSPWRQRLLDELKRVDTLICNAIYGLTFFVGEGILMSTITYYIISVFGEDLTFNGYVITAATAGGIILSLRALISAFTAPFVGKASDTVRNRWVIIIIGAGAGILGLLILINFTTPYLLLLGIAIFAVNSATVQAVIPAILMDSNKNGKVSFRLGMMATSADIGLALAPLISYSILQRYTISSLYYLGVLMLVLSLALGVIATNRYRSKKENPEVQGYQ